MSYQVLARKWRPQQFQDLLGQEHVKRALSNALKEQRLHHAYLFTGTRGVGKTTIARILAKCLNCEQGVSATPCDQCQHCQAISQGRFVDVIEVDAASKTKVEDTRELLDNVHYLPTVGHYKIYIIDEVHMLSNHSFNALLKTLEEPPPHVKFLLATTDPQRLPITVLSRCLQFNLKPLTIKQIETQLSHILEQEQVEFEAGALSQLSHAALGSVRDALSLLDQALAYGEGCISDSLVQQMLGTVSRHLIDDMMTAICQQDGQAIIQLSQQIVDNSGDFDFVCQELLHYFHQISLQQALSDYQSPTLDNEKLQHYAQQISPADVQIYYDILQQGRQQLPLSVSAQVGFEMTLLRILCFTKLAPSSSNATIPPAAKPAKRESSAQPTTSAATTQKPSKPSANVESPSIEMKKDLDWQHLCQQLNLKGPVLALANNSSLHSIEDQHFVFHINPGFNMLSSKREQLQQALRDHFKQAIRVTIECHEEPLATPSKLAQQQQQQQIGQAQAEFDKDTKLKQLIDTFDGKILADSIQLSTDTVK